MPRRRTHSSPPSPPPPQAQARPSGGILSGVLSFVSREFESFVASATGTSPAAVDLRRNLDKDDDVEDYSDDDEQEEDERRRRRRRDRSPPRKRTRHAPSHSRKRTPSPDAPPRKRRSASRSYKRRRRRSPSTESQQDSQSSSSQSRTPSPAPAPSAPAAPVPLMRALKRRPSMTMPGSLFPRSPSMEPDYRPERDHRVRFTSSGLRPSPSPSPATPPPDSSCQSSDVPLPASVHLPESSSSSSPSTPRRTRTNVQSAADRFHVGAEDAGPSILLPSPHTSPTAYRLTRSPGVDKGKARAIDETDEGNTSGVLRVRGKEQELVAAREELDRLDRHQRLLAEDHEDAEGETSFLHQVERDRDKDKARIRMLEEEIARLKQELSKRSTTTTNASTSYPYPPPPPPPPPPHPLPRKTIINVPSTSDDPNLFASARASLKQAPPPIENPIVPVRRAGIATLGLAPDKMAAFLNEMKTVRLRKTTSAPSNGGRSVHDNGNATFVAPTPPSRVAQLAPRRSLEGLHQRGPLMDEDAPMAPDEWAALRAKVRAEMDDTHGRAGEKRKRSGDANALAEDSRGGPTKRISGIRTTAGTTSAHSSFASTSTSTSGSGSSAHRGLPRRTSTPLSSFSQPPQSQSQSQTQSQVSPLSPPPPVRSAIPPATTTWQTSSVTDAPTPSLCSDNENYNEDERGVDGWAAGQARVDDDDDDQAPVTPPIGVGGGSGPSRSFFRFKGNGVPVEETEEAIDKSINMSRAMDRSMNRSMNASMNRSLNRSMNTSTQAVGDMAGSTTSRPARAANAPTSTSAPVNTRPKATGIPRLKTRAPARPRAHSPPAAPATPPPPPQDDDDDNEEHKEDRPSTFIRARDAAPRASIGFFAGRAPSSPMPISPRRPRAPGRVASRGSASGSGIRTSAGYGAPGYTPGVRRVADVAVERYEEVEEQMEEEQPPEEEGRDNRASFLLPAPSLPERTPSPSTAHRPTSRARSQSQNLSQSRQKQPKNKASPKPKPTLKRRLTLDEELRSAVPFLHEDADEEEDADAIDAHVDPGDAYMAEVAQQDADEMPDAPREEDLDSGVLVGVGTRSKRRGFLAHGGAGGTPVFMGVGYIEGAEEDEALEAGVGDDGYEDRNGNEYADEAQDGAYDAGDDDDGDDDEYVPSPAPRSRQVKSQRRR